MIAKRRPPSWLVPIDFSIVDAPVDASATMESADDGLSKLNLPDKTMDAMLTSPEAKML